jgi:hypothetical protein
VTTARQVTRRDFLRLRSSRRGPTLELSCRALFMRCADACVEQETQPDYEPWMGEPPAVLQREPAQAILDRVERELHAARVVRLLEPEWLASMAGAARLQSALAAFRDRGGTLEYGPVAITADTTGDP